MICTEVKDLSELSCRLDTAEAVYIGAAGFETRAVKTLETMLTLGLRIQGAVIIAYDDEERIEENEKNLVEMTRLSAILSRPDCVTHLMASEIQNIDEAISRLNFSPNSAILLDITGMSHFLMLRTVSQPYLGQNPLIILYTEAEKYRPFKEDVSQALECKDEYSGFLVLTKNEYEQAEMMFSGDYKIVYVPEFVGHISPQLPSVLIAFPTFKRVRVSTIITPLEVNHRIFILGKAVRSDLEWRTRLLRMINYDLMDENTDSICVTSTLSPHDTYKQLLKELNSKSALGPCNIIIVPFGSKMQTVGVWKYCEQNPEVRVVISQPKKFHPQKYSVGSGSSFFFDPNLPWPHPTTQE